MPAITLDNITDAVINHGDPANCGYRACHIHYRVQAPGHEPLTTMM